MKKVRQFLRVSSDQQLDKDGDLKVQRKEIADYISNHDDWCLDKKEYFEGGVSAYKNTSMEREELQKVEIDAKNHEFDILVAYKDDRIGRLIDDTPAFIMRLKRYGVDVYTVIDGCITPQNNTPEERLMLTFRYFSAHKSSADTAVRVRDTAKRLIEDGKFMGGKAPYGYQLVESGEISKHKRLLYKLTIDNSKVDVVKYIYHLSYNKEYGSAKIASVLNRSLKYKNLAPNDVWKGGTITSILTNPIYTGYIVYKRREYKNNPQFSNTKDWLSSKTQNKDLVIIDKELWLKTQEKRILRGKKYTKKLENQNVTIISRNDGQLPLIDVLYCAECDHKMINGSKYDYWTIKSTGERRTSKKPIYKCQQAWQGVPHHNPRLYRAENIEPIIFSALSEYIGKLLEKEDILTELQSNKHNNNKLLRENLEQEQNSLSITRQKLQVIRNKILESELENTLLDVDDLKKLLEEHKENERVQSENIEKLKEELAVAEVSLMDWEQVCSQIPTWQEIFLDADNSAKRVLINRLVNKITVSPNEIKIYFKINLNDFF